MSGAQAASAQVKLLRFTINLDSRWLDIGKPASSGMLLGMAYPMAKVYRFATHIAFCSQIVNSFSTNECVNYPDVLTTGVELYHNLQIIKRRRDEANSFR